MGYLCTSLGLKKPSELSRTAICMMVLLCGFAEVVGNGERCVNVKLKKRNSAIYCYSIYILLIPKLSKISLTSFSSNKCC